MLGQRTLKANRSNLSGGGGGAFAPDDISGLVVWYDSQFKTLNGSNVSALLDQGPNSDDITQSTAADQPLWNSSDSDFNNQPSIQGDTVSEFMDISAFTGGDVAQPSTIVTVAKFISVVSFRFMYDSDNNSFRQTMFLDSGGPWGIFAGTTLSGGTGDTSPHIFIAIFNGASSKLYVDGGTAVLSGDAGTQAMRGLTICARNLPANYSDVKMAEKVIYDNEVSASDLNDLGSHYDSKYGITYTNI